MKSIEEQIGSKCAHFNGLSRGRCDAGVLYDSFGLPPQPYRKELPCFVGCTSGAVCDKRRFYTADEVAAKVQELKLMCGRSARAREAAVFDAARNKRSAGSCPCPTCGGTIAYSIGANKHMHLVCSTPDCCAFIE